MRKTIGASSLILTTLAALAAISCGGSNIPAGQIRVRNDSRDREYNTITVSGGGVAASLKPDQSVLLPRGTRSFTVQRRYATFTRSYSVSCPAIKGAGVLIKMIDIHVNRLPAGCTTVTASKG